MPPRIQSVAARLERPRAREPGVPVDEVADEAGCRVRGQVVAGSRGIGLTPLAVPCGNRCFPEDWRKVWGDGLRAALWVVSGRDFRDWAAERFGPLLEEVRGR